MGSPFPRAIILQRSSDTDIPNRLARWNDARKGNGASSRQAERSNHNNCPVPGDLNRDRLERGFFVPAASCSLAPEQPTIALLYRGL